MGNISCFSVKTCPSTPNKKRETGHLCNNSFQCSNQLYERFTEGVLKTWWRRWSFDGPARCSLSRIGETRDASLVVSKISLFSRGARRLEHNFASVITQECATHGRRGDDNKMRTSKKIRALFYSVKKSKMDGCTKYSATQIIFFSFHGVRVKRRNLTSENDLKI